MLHGYVIRGTTPTHKFDLPYTPDLIEDLRVIYGQNKKSVFSKIKEDCVIKEGKLIVDLLQEETLLFMPNKTVSIEIKIKLITGKVVRNKEPIILGVIDSVSDEVIE